MLHTIMHKFLDFPSGVAKLMQLGKEEGGKGVANLLENLHRPCIGSEWWDWPWVSSNPQIMKHVPILTSCKWENGGRENGKNSSQGPFIGKARCRASGYMLKHAILKTQIFLHRSSLINMKSLSNLTCCANVVPVSGLLK